MGLKVLELRGRSDELEHLILLHAHHFLHGPQVRSLLCRGEVHPSHLHLYCTM